jgi:hypothetical protein
MQQVIRCALLVLFAAVPVDAQPNTRDLSSGDIVWGVTTLRRYLLQDSTPIDFCGLPELFGADGVLPRDPTHPFALYATLRDCSNASQESRPRLRVEVLSRSTVGDTVVIHAVAYRRGISFLEEYHFGRPLISILGPRDGHHQIPMYRIVAFVER